jgi:hypothetical protein
MGALQIAVTEKDEVEGGRRRLDLVTLASQDRRNPARMVQRWWLDSSGAVLRGERRVYEEGADKPVSETRYDMREEKLHVDKKSSFGGEESKEERDLVLPANFVPNDLLALFLVPREKGKTWKFSTFVVDRDLGMFTITDAGAEKVRTRAGTVEARKLVLKKGDREDGYWLDSEMRIVRVRPSLSPNLEGVAGTADESRADWATRPDDEVDVATTKLLAELGSLESLARDSMFGIHDEKGKVSQSCATSLKKESKDGRPALHYVFASAFAAEAEEPSCTTRTELWLGLDGKLQAGSAVTQQKGEDPRTTTVKVEGGSLVLQNQGQKDERQPLGSNFVPDLELALRAAARSRGGPLRFTTVDNLHAWCAPHSVWLEALPAEKIQARCGPVKARRIHFFQEYAEEGTAWVSDEGTVLLVKWERTQLVAGTHDESEEDLDRPLGPDVVGLNAPLTDEEMGELTRYIDERISRQGTRARKELEAKDTANALRHLRRTIEWVRALPFDEPRKDRFESIPQYNYARGLCLSGQKDEALKAFERAIELGVSDWKFIEGDHSLDDIRGEARFKNAIEKGKSRSAGK